MAKILVCGDFTTCGKGLDSVKAGLALDENIVKIIKTADASFVNVECPVAAPSDLKIEKSGPNLRTESFMISYLKKCGFTHATLANNHLYDYADEGVKKTIKALENERIGFVGAGRTKEERHKPLFLEIDRTKLIVLNYCENEFSIHEPMGSNPLNPITAYYDIKKAKEICHHVIIICHGGHEGYNLPSPRMVELYRYFIDCGASIVINHHQHCYSGWEEYKGGQIFYGLGNFFFDDHRPPQRRNTIWNYGYIVSLNIDAHRINSELIPYTQCLKEKTTKLIEDKDERIVFEKNIHRLNAIIQDDKALMQNFDSFCKTQYKNIITHFSPYNCRLLQALCRRGLLPTFLNKQRRLDIMNKIRCEAHRDVVIHVLNQE